jgi:hypothetical protein
VSLIISLASCPQSGHPRHWPQIVSTAWSSSSSASDCVHSLVIFIIELESCLQSGHPRHRPRIVFAASLSASYRVSCLVCVVISSHRAGSLGSVVIGLHPAVSIVMSLELGQRCRQVGILVGVVIVVIAGGLAWASSPA